MSDQVQRRLEAMVPELRDLQEKGLFSRNEIRKIVNQRRVFEYRVVRRQPLKADFMRYIEYELNLEQLRFRRYQRLGPFKKASVSDFAIVRRIHQLYERAVRAHWDDVSLWMQFIHFSIQRGGSKVLGKLFPRALQLHPTNAQLWITAAVWQFEKNGDITSARVMYQRGLRLNKTSRDLWVRFFQMEVIYMRKLRARRELLGLSEHNGDVDVDSDPALQAIFNGVIALAIFDNAVRPHEDDQVHQLKLQRKQETDYVPLWEDYDFRQRFLDLVPVPQDASRPDYVRIIRQHVLESIERDFVNEPRAWVARARCAMQQELYDGSQSDDKQHDVLQVELAALNVFERAVSSDSPLSSSTDMWRAYADHVRHRLEHYSRLAAQYTRRNADTSAASVQQQLRVWNRLVVYMFDKAIAILQRAEDAGAIDSALLRTWSRLLFESGHVDEGVHKLEESVARTPTDVASWQYLIRVSARRVALSTNHGDDALEQLCERAVKATASTDNSDVWQAYIDVASALFSDDKAQTVLQRASSATRCASCVAFKLMYVDFLAASSGDDDEAAAQQLTSKVRTLVAHAPVSVDLYVKCAALLASHALPDEWLFEAAVRDFGAHSARLWLLFYSSVARRNSGNVALAQRVHWRALKALGGDAAQKQLFIERHALNSRSVV